MFRDNIYLDFHLPLKILTGINTMVLLLKIVFWFVYKAMRCLSARLATLVTYNKTQEINLERVVFKWKPQDNAIILSNPFNVFFTNPVKMSNSALRIKRPLYDGAKSGTHIILTAIMFLRRDIKSKYRIAHDWGSY